MKNIILFIVFLPIQLFGQVVNFEHWDDEYNKEDSKAIEKTKDFMQAHGLVINEIYSSGGKTKRKFQTGEPYLFAKNGDTLVYLIPGSLFPTLQQDYSEMFENSIHPYYIETIRKDGRLGIRTCREFRFLFEDGKLYYLFLTSSLGKEKDLELGQKVFETDDTVEQKRIINYLNQFLFYKKEEIFDHSKQLINGDIINYKDNRYSKLISKKKINGIEIYDIETKITILGDLCKGFFQFDNKGNIHKIYEWEVKQ